MEYIWEVSPSFRRAFAATTVRLLARSVYASIMVGFVWLPLELRLLIASSMGADATIKDWNSWKGVCRSERLLWGTYFAEWLGSQPPGTVFGLCGGKHTGLSFVRPYVQCMYVAAAFLHPLTRGSVSSNERFHNARGAAVWEG